MILTQQSPQHYAALLAHAYLLAPDASEVPYIRDAYAALVDHTSELFARIPVEVVFCPGDTYDEVGYTNVDAMRHDVLVHRRLYVDTRNSDHPILTPRQNWEGRAVHDYFTHVMAHGAVEPYSRPQSREFTFEGELETYADHVVMTDHLPWSEQRPILLALASEVLGQLGYHEHTGFFWPPPQKVVDLAAWGFSLLTPYCVDIAAYQFAAERVGFDLRYAWGLPEAVESSPDVGDVPPGETRWLALYRRDEHGFAALVDDLP